MASFPQLGRRCLTAHLARQTPSRPRRRYPTPQTAAACTHFQATSAPPLRAQHVRKATSAEHSVPFRKRQDGAPGEPRRSLLFAPGPPSTPSKEPSGHRGAVSTPCTQCTVDVMCGLCTCIADDLQHGLGCALCCNGHSHRHGVSLDTQMHAVEARSRVLLQKVICVTEQHVLRHQLAGLHCGYGVTVPLQRNDMAGMP